jgi:signal transduction histidine kinase
MKWSLRARVTAMVTAAALLLGLIAAAGTAVAATNRSQLDVVLNKTGPLRTNGEKLNNAMVNQQTGMRGFVLTGDESELATFQSGRSEEDALYAAMVPLLGDLPEIRAQLELVRSTAAQWRAEVADRAIAEVRANGPEAAQLLLTQVAGTRFETVRAEIAQLQAEVLEVRNIAVDAVSKSGNLLVYLLIGAAIVVLLTGIGLIMMLHRTVTRPVTDLATQVRAVASGAYNTDISGEGPPEIMRLASDVNSMRRQIATDLDAVNKVRQEIEAVNAQLELQAAELTRSNRDLEQFAYVASHDLQEPLRKVASFCQLLQRRYSGQLDDRADQYIAFAVDGAERMQRLINDLLAFSRIGRSNANFVPVSLDSVMTEVASQLEAPLRNTGGTLTWSELPEVPGEEALLHTLLANLIGNSLKFRREDVPPEVRVSASMTDGLWTISVRDNGIGVEDEYAEKIFVIFQRLHGKEAYPGTGIGLAIAKKIVEYHGGQIRVSSSGDTEGTTISFTLPVVVEAKQLEELAA